MKRVYGAAFGPLKEMAGRKHVRELTGQSWVPVLQLDDGSTVQGSGKIIEWAEAHPRT